MSRRVGVVAVQGDYEKHLDAFARIGCADACEVRTPEELGQVDSIVIPGGESTTVGKLMARFGLGPAIQQRASSGTPVWGTCMGMILMAKSVEDSDQYSLGIIDIDVRRNAFGAQVHSFEDTLDVDGIADDLTAVFIRAPIVTRWGDDVHVLSHYGDAVVAVRQGRCVGTSFHPELTDDTRMHAWFLEL